MKLLFTQFFVITSPWPPLRPRYLSQHLVLIHSQPMLLVSVTDQVSNPYEIGKIIFLYILFYILPTASSSSYTCSVLGHVTCSGPVKSREIFLRCCSWLRFPHGWYFIIKCGSQSICRTFSTHLFLQFCVYFTTGLILSWDQISSLVL